MDRLGKVVEWTKQNQAYIINHSRELRANELKCHRERSRVRRKEDMAFRLVCSLRGRIRSALLGANKSMPTRQLLGCTLSVLRFHLEVKFTAGMTWENYGAWHIDHIRPCCSFDMTKPEDQLECFHYTNLQPLWAHDNSVKSGSLPKPERRRRRR